MKNLNSPCVRQEANQLQGKLTVADIQADNYRPSLRNKLVAERFYLTDAIEKYGSGFIRIHKALREYPEVEFTVEEKFGGIMATFTQQASDTFEVSGGVSTPEDFLAVTQTQPGLNAAELVRLSGKPQRTVERWLKQLRDAGLVEFISPPKTGGYQQKRLALPGSASRSP